ncbi:Ubiquitin-2 like Rad60 SUMO-like [Seminavis robusta]|uniref:Ubiquitin-2 like Rad60 SUMO-like n=1 Tax=Seminavis robusta TaxID=568900 RepID=A0A9N8DSS1_9STRA|nr:Ubiquitin-2 like Rad60 SUMO-like [Seminavis robusta]|eukprot:Sro225_g091840.1 Ubiquitin-2 like Rad60 SUMO-like (262) ;mRNA; r:53773-54772
MRHCELFALVASVLTTVSGFSPPCASLANNRLDPTPSQPGHEKQQSPSCLHSYDARGDYYGESSGSYMVKEFAEYEQLEEIVKLAAMPLPERPDGIVCVAKFTSSQMDSCVTTEAEYERLARDNPATIFLRCFAEYENADILIGKASVQSWPTFDIFYQGNRVARVEGSNFSDLEELLNRYQFQNSQLDLFSEESSNPWGDRSAKDMSKTPRTTARFIPGYDWGSAKGFFDDLGDKAAASFEETFENWVPPMDDDDGKSSK